MYIIIPSYHASFEPPSVVGADDGGSEAHVGHVGVDLGGRDAAVAQEFRFWT